MPHAEIDWFQQLRHSQKFSRFFSFVVNVIGSLYPLSRHKGHQMHCKVDIEKRVNMNFEFFEVDAMGISSYRDEHELKARGVVIGPWGNLAVTNTTLLQLQLQHLLLLLLGQEGSHLLGQGLWCLLLIIGWHDPPLLSHTASQSLLCWLLVLQSAVSISANQPVQSNSLTALTNLISYLRGALCPTTPITTVVYSGLRTFGGGENWVINLCRRLRDSPRSICSSASPNTLVGPP